MIQQCPSCGKEYRSANKITIFGCCSHKTRRTIEGYLVKIEKPPAKPYQPPPPKPDTSNEPGSVLYRILRDVFEVKPKPGCGCHKLRDEMDSLGVEGCQADFGRLVDRLKENAKAYRWLESFGAALNAVRNGALGWMDPFRPWESILKHAIETSRELKAVANAGKEIDQTDARRLGAGIPAQSVET